MKHTGADFTLKALAINLIFEIMAIAALLTYCSSSHVDVTTQQESQVVAEQEIPQQNILNAICLVESGGREDVVGDNGKAIGPYQIHREYWQDALEFDPSIGGKYKDCVSRGYSEKVVAAYMRRYAQKAWNACDAEVISRIHNGGPQGYKKEATVKYWHRVRSILVNKDRSAGSSRVPRPIFFFT